MTDINTTGNDATLNAAQGPDVTPATADTTALTASTAASTSPKREDRKSGKRNGKGKHHGKSKDEGQKPARSTTLVAGDRFVGKDATMIDPSRYPNMILVQVIKDGKQERAMLIPDGLTLDRQPSSYKSLDERRAALREKLGAIKEGKLTLPAVLVVEMDKQGRANFVDGAFLDKREKAIARRNDEAEYEANVAIARTLEGVDVSNVVAVNALTGPVKGKDGERIVVKGLFVRVVGTTRANGVDGFLNAGQILGGRKRADEIAADLAAGKKVTFDKLKVVAVSEDKKEPVARGRIKLRLELSEMASFPFGEGESVRGAKYIADRNGLFMLAWNGYELFLDPEKLPITRESFQRAPGLLTFKGLTNGRLMVEKRMEKKGS